MDGVAIGLDFGFVLVCGWVSVFGGRGNEREKKKGRMRGRLPLWILEAKKRSTSLI